MRFECTDCGANTFRLEPNAVPTEAVQNVVCDGCGDVKLRSVIPRDVVPPGGGDE